MGAVKHLSSSKYYCNNTYGVLLLLFSKGWVLYSSSRDGPINLVPCNLFRRYKVFKQSGYVNTRGGWRLLV